MKCCLHGGHRPTEVKKRAKTGLLLSAHIRIVTTVLKRKPMKTIWLCTTHIGVMHPHSVDFPTVWDFDDFLYV